MGSMPDATKYPQEQVDERAHRNTCSLNGHARAAETTGAEGWRIFTSLPVSYLNCGGGDRWCCYL
ncbi:hypothetical protein TNCV_3519971 [Trichonephila clavipes]|nr:hypothetical protein TNCV_3519971 [Trichonephila clavipes]